MATPRILKIIRQARANNATAQLELGRRYLTGGEGLRKSFDVAYQWLAAAADQGLNEASWLIGEYIPTFAVDRIDRAMNYYIEAQRQGSTAAEVALAKWALGGNCDKLDEQTTAHHLYVLHNAASQGNTEAQLAVDTIASIRTAAQNIIDLISAAELGEVHAIAQVIEHYWMHAGGDLWRPGQTPGQITSDRDENQITAARLALHWHETHLRKCTGRGMSAAEIRRHGSLLLLTGHEDARRCLYAAAEQCDAIAAYLLGLMYMGPEYIDGLPNRYRENTADRRIFPGRNYKQAAYWLEKASMSPLAEADYALWVLNGLRNYSMRDPDEQQRRLLRAARMGHGEACRLKGCEAQQENDLIAAAGWFEQALTLGNARSRADINAFIYESPEPDERLLNAAKRIRHHDPRLAIRLELAAHFDLLEHEFLLLDPQQADRENFLLVDVRKGYRRASPRLVRINSTSQRNLLRRAQQLLAPHSTTLFEDYPTLRRRFRQHCRRHAIAPFWLMSPTAVRNEIEPA